jgi:predicted RNA binding protein YcfA (HicA-like mRNA interferase family)
MVAKLPQISGKELIKILQKVGFNVISQRGSHIKLRKVKPIRKTIIVPNRRVIRSGTLNNIIKMAEISKDELIKLLQK